MSVVVGLTRDVEGIGQIWKKSRQDLRNIVDRRRGKSPAWDAVELDAWLEVDCVQIQDVPLLGSDKQQQVHELCEVGFDETGPVWSITFHGIVFLGLNLSLNDLSEAFTSKWRGYRQVDVRSFYGKRSTFTNIGGIVNYALKNACETTFSDGLSCLWDRKSVVDYNVCLQSFSRGFQSLRTRIGSKEEKAVVLNETKGFDAGMEVGPGVCVDGDLSENHMVFITEENRETPVLRPHSPPGQTWFGISTYRSCRLNQGRCLDHDGREWSPNAEVRQLVDQPCLSRLPLVLHRH